MADTPSTAATPYISPNEPTFQAFKGDLVTVSAKSPLPPGSRVEFDLALPRENKSVRLVGKVATVFADGPAFRINVRVHSLSREIRAALNAENTP